jgi:sterol desaturase/sphingolipid hydroxylase (fatty acid hydroxylase superfamily)
VNPLLYPLFFLAGWAAGLFGEYVLHWSMHRFSLRFHIEHHHEFFRLPEMDVALNTIDTRMNIRYFLLLLLVSAPLMLLVGWQPVALVWAGAFWHLTLVYEIVHALFHYEHGLPRSIRCSRLFIWWKGCHAEHHRNSPTGNYCVTCPLLDMLFGSYVRPRAESETAAPVQQRNPA